MTQASKVMSAAVAAVVVGMFVGRADAGSGQSSCSAGAGDCAAPASSVASSAVAAENPGDALTLDPVHIMDVETAGDTDTGWYAAVIGGYSFPDDLEVENFDVALDEGYAILGAVGTNVGAFRIEAEAGFRMNDVGEAGASGDVSAISVMGNILYDHPLADAIDLYVGGGVGAAMVELEDDDGGTSDDDTVLAYQFLVGLAFYTSDNFAITTGYRLWTASDLDIDGVDVGVPLYHQAEVGVRFEF